MDIVIIIFILVGGSIALSAFLKNRSSRGTEQPLDKESPQPSAIRKCAVCAHEGEMKTWLSNYTAPKIITLVGFVLGYLPGLIFLAVYWGKYKCPHCGAVGKNIQAG